MNKAKVFFRVEKGASGKCADISKIVLKVLIFFFTYLRLEANEILGKVIKFQVNTISLSKVVTFFLLGGGGDSSLPPGLIGLREKVWKDYWPPCY